MSGKYLKRQISPSEVEDNLTLLDGVFCGLEQIKGDFYEDLIKSQPGAAIILDSLLDSGTKQLKEIQRIITTDIPRKPSVKINPKYIQGSKEQSSEEIEELGPRGLPDDIMSGTTRAHLLGALKGDDPHGLFNQLANEAVGFAGQIEELMLLALEADGESAAKKLIGLQDRICMNANDVFHQIWDEEIIARKAKERAA